MPHKVQSWTRPSIETALDRGEQIEACSFFIGSDEANRKSYRWIVLTNRNLRFIGFKTSWTFFAPQILPVVANFAIPLHTLTAVGVNRTRGSIITVAIEVHWAGAPERWESSYEDADDLARRLELLLAKQTAAAQGSGIADEIAKLNALASEGALTSEEFQRGKELFLGRAPDKAAEIAQMLRQLHGLYLGKVLSEAEFNMKKWELLSK